jgi:hypothetical protein
MCCLPVNTTQSPKIATDSSAAKVDDSFTKTQRLFHHSVGTEHYFVHVKFEVKFVMRKLMSNEKWHIS